MTKRKEDWQQHFVAYMAEIIRLPFDERIQHCGYFAGDGIKAMTGQDLLLKGLRDSVDLREMLDRVKELGFKDHVEYVASIFPEINPLEAMPGDIAILPGEGGASLGLVQGDYIYAIGAEGVMMVPRSEGQRWFRV